MMTSNNNWQGRGAVHIYTGPGKGKTTAAIGLAVRASGAGLQVRFVQFLKGGHYAEHQVLSKLPGVRLQHFGRDEFIFEAGNEQDVQAAQRAWQSVKQHCLDPAVDLVIADELNMAVRFNLLDEQEVIDWFKRKLNKIELVLTGRDAGEKMIEQADLVTEMQAVKHYFDTGRSARQGIEY